jgi:predicted AAA+ superfamily ATPase
MAGSRIIERHARRAVEAALDDTRVVAVLGARQVGKSTLVAEIVGAEGKDRPIITFDDQPTRAAASADPAGWLAGLGPIVAIDEIQRVPDVLLEIKKRVDRDHLPGQFIVTGSANVLEMRKVKDSLAGRAEYLRLHPFSQGELAGRRESFIPAMFEGSLPQLVRQPVGRKPFVSMIAAGGYPEAVRRQASRRARFFESYIDGILEKDLDVLREISNRAQVRQLLQAIAATSASELNFQSLSRDLGIANNTVRAYADVLETLFLVKRLPPWSRNLTTRAIKSPKAYISDTGLLTYLVGANETRLETDLGLGGMFFETFVAMELQRQADWLDEPLRLYHFRDKDKREVDLVIERNDGAVIGIEVKASATVHGSDLRGLQHLAARLGDDFRAGALVYTGETTVPFGERLAAVPLRGLWA